MKKNVLLIEDSNVFGNIVIKRLESNKSLNVVWTKTLAETVNILKKNMLFYTAIADYNLPDAPDGEVIDILIDANIPTIVYTGKLNSQIRENVWKKDVVNYFLKNDALSLDNLLEQIEQIEINKQTKVLVIDDSIVFRKMLMDLLKVHKFKVLSAIDGEIGLKVIEQHPDIKLVITDYEMPKKDGLLVTEEIRKTYSKDEMGIIGLSSVGDALLSARFIKTGANDFIVKQSFLAEEFYTRVSQVLLNIMNIQKMKELNELKNKVLGIAAHDLRNPIGAIRGFSEILQGDDVPDELRKEALTLIYESSEEMLTLLNELLDISYIESGQFELKKEELMISVLVEKRIRLAEQIAKKKNIKINYDVSNMVTIECDSGKISQVLDNLISNAIKYSPLETVINVSVETIDDYIRILVKDEGPGISEDEQDSLFGEFAKISTKSTAGEKSTGLGLAIAKKIIEAHDGRIGVISKQGEGSTFYFDLPID